MFITKMAMSRRTLLRGIGTTLALPLLDGMVPALTAPAAAIKDTRTAVQKKAPTKKKTRTASSKKAELFSDEFATPTCP